MFELDVTDYFSARIGLAFCSLADAWLDDTGKSVITQGVSVDAKHITNLFNRVEIAWSNCFYVYHDFLVLRLRTCSIVAMMQPIEIIGHMMLSYPPGLRAMKQTA